MPCRLTATRCSERGHVTRCVGDDQSPLSQDPANTSHCVSLLDARRGVCAFTRAEVVVVRWIACKGPGGVLLWCVRLWIAPFSLRKKYSVVPNHPSKSRFHNVDCFVERGMILDRSKVMSAGTPVQK
jgi:hypothetical protein